MGAIEYNNGESDSYIDDSGYYTQSSNELTTGWGWGIASVNATERIDVRGTRGGPRPVVMGWGGAGSDETDHDQSTDDYSDGNDNNNKNNVTTQQGGKYLVVLRLIIMTKQ
ncbi:hypothetical protein ACMAZF_11905 [Psychrobium sp. nBUS_13]|uniref:hypothetical protein n=1 Tax=Psychrobium sp. nBUS_13 TaxID=3395319 RepID=UPI003EBFA1EF